MEQNNLTLKVIAYARNGHTDKFGIPRQSREDSPIQTRIVFEPGYNVPEALRGIEAFSHLWILWGFSEAQCTKDWAPTVRPPRLGGNKRMGVFATRSPFRPNPIGLTSVRLLAVQYATRDNPRMELLVSGADLMDGTPVYDIKPYLSFSDCHTDAINGFATQTADYRLELTLPPDELLIDVPEKVLRDIVYILKQDPRPAYQHDPDREYKMDYAGWRTTFLVQTEEPQATTETKSRVMVKKIEKIE